MSSAPRVQTRRPALEEATVRVNNTQPNMVPPPKSAMPHHESRNVQRNSNSAASRPASHDNATRRSASVTPAVPNLRLSEIRNEDTSSKRDSHASTDSSRSRIKICVGPWRLGRTLGEGATARVRLAKHIYTGQMAAVKIVAKQNALISQAGSLANLEKADLDEPEEDGIRRMPVGIEREVAIMKLIQHPNIMKLYDIWENRTEM
jgi:serine/threonine-protein kinase HSL1 (negative regulator of Swe1 kinase)